MFTGIVERVCKVVAVRPAVGVAGSTPAADGLRLEVELGDLLADLRVGASVAVNGACLTLAERRGSAGVFDVVPETWRMTNLRTLQPGDRVNVERSLHIGDRLDGHFVQGHVDGLGRIDRVQRDGGQYKVWIVADSDLMACIVRKGSVAVDGVSLTVVEVEAERFSVALIPTTLTGTVLGLRRPGDQVNIETDILARLVISRLAALAGGEPPRAGEGVSWERLQKSGFVS